MATVCNADANGRGVGIVVGGRGSFSKVEATGAGVGNASVKIWID
jgi:hypothetical protein